MAKEKYNVLVLDDDEELLELVKVTLDMESEYKVYTANNARKALTIEKKIKPDLLISDIILPDMTGYEVCKKLRDENNKIPVIFMSGKKIKEEDKITGFISGCDDYIIKPFNPRELVFRVKAILRRAYPERERKDNIFIDENINKVYFEGKLIKGLSPKEFDLFMFLYNNRPKVMSKEKILQAIWEKVDEGTNRSLEVYIQRLRKKLDNKIAKNIETVPTKGYRYAG